YRLFAKIVRALIITPIQWTVRLLLASFLRIMQIIFTVFIFIAKCIFLPIIWFLKMVYRLLPDNMQNILHKIAGFYSIIKNICSKWMKYIKFKRREQPVPAKKKITRLDSNYMQQYDAYMERQKRKKQRLIRRLVLFSIIAVIAIGSMATYHIKQRVLQAEKS